MTLNLQNYVKKYAIFVTYISVFIFALSLEPIPIIITNYRRILMSSSVLLTDYLFVGDLSATLINVLLTTGLNIIIIKRLKVEVNGAIFACLLTIAGFAFFGKNLYNALPIYFGVYLFCKVTRAQ